MSVLDSDPNTLTLIIGDPGFDEAQVAAAAFLARYSGRTLDAYRYDLRTFFQWAADVGLAVLEATAPPHRALPHRHGTEKVLRPSTIDRRLSTVCGFYRFAHIDGRVERQPGPVRPTAQGPPLRGPRARSPGARDVPLHGRALRSGHAALAVLLGLNGLRVSEACGTNVEDLAFDQGHRTLRIMGKGSKPAVIPLVPRAARTIDLAIGERTRRPDPAADRTGARLDRRTAHRWVRSIGKRAGLEARLSHTCSGRPSSWPPSIAGVPLRDVQIAARHADPRTTTVYDRGGRTSTGMPPTSWWPSWPADRRGPAWSERHDSIVRVLSLRSAPAGQAGDRQSRKQSPRPSAPSVRRQL